MKLLSITALCSVFALAAADPLAALEKTVSRVEVKSDLSAYEETNVHKFWPTLDEDLAVAISEKLNVDDQADAPGISVEINKVSIDGDTILPDSGEFNTLEGTVTTHTGINAKNVNSEAVDDNAQTGSYALRMIAVSGERDAPEGWVIVAPTQDDFYKTLVGSYASTIVERIDE